MGSIGADGAGSEYGTFEAVPNDAAAPMAETIIEEAYELADM